MKLTNQTTVTGARPPEPQPKISFASPWHLIQCSLPVGYSLARPEAFWQAVQDIHGVVEIISEGVYQFTVKARSEAPVYFYIQAIQEAARKQGRGYVQDAR